MYGISKNSTRLLYFMTELRREKVQNFPKFPYFPPPFWISSSPFLFQRDLNSNSANTQYTGSQSTAFPQCVAGGSGLRLPGNLRSPAVMRANEGGLQRAGRLRNEGARYKKVAVSGATTSPEILLPFSLCLRSHPLSLSLSSRSPLSFFCSSCSF